MESIEELLSELSFLFRKQQEARTKGAYIQMSAEEISEYERRAIRMIEIHGLLGEHL